MSKVAPAVDSPAAESRRNSSSRISRLPTWAAERLSKSTGHLLFGPRDDKEAQDAKDARAAKHEIEASGAPGSPLVSLLMCVPVVLHILAMIYGFVTTTWLCKPGDPCSLPTTAPVRLGSYMTFYLASWAPFPLHVTLLYATAMRHASDVVLERIIKKKKKTNELDDLEVAFLEAAVRKPSAFELVQTLLTYTLILLVVLLFFVKADGDGSFFEGERAGLHVFFVVGLAIVVPVAMLLIWFTFRNLRVSMVRRKRGFAPSYIRESIWPKVVNVVIIQGLIMLFFMITCLGSSQAPRTSFNGRIYEPGCPTAAINSTYISLYCDQTYATRLDKYVRLCDDGGYDRFPSMLDSCEAHYIVQALVARSQASLAAGLSALLVVILPDYAFGLKDGLTWANWATKASPRFIGAIIFGFVAALSGIIEMLFVISPETRGPNENLSFTDTALVQFLAFLACIAGWISCIVLLGTEFGVSKLAELKLLQKEQDDAKDEVKRQKDAGIVTFWFVKRSFILENTSIPVFQELRKRGDALQKVDIPKQAVIQGELANDGSRLAVSHSEGSGSNTYPAHTPFIAVSLRYHKLAAQGAERRARLHPISLTGWMDPIEPDEDGTQTDAIRAYLEEHPAVQLVWFDFWCVSLAFLWTISLCPISHQMRD